MTNRQFKDFRINKLRGMTQKDLAKFMRLHQSNISRLENGFEGRKPTKQQVAMLNLIKWIFDHGQMDEYERKMR